MTLNKTFSILFSLVLEILYIKSKLTLFFFLFGVPTLSFKYGKYLLNSSDLILLVPADSVGFTVL